MPPYSRGGGSMIWFFALPALAIICIVLMVFFCYAIAKFGNDGKY